MLFIIFISKYQTIFHIRTKKLTKLQFRVP